MTNPRELRSSLFGRQQTLQVQRRRQIGKEQQVEVAVVAVVDRRRLMVATG
jgi:hypothetical protein